MPGRVVAVQVAAGERVAKGQPLLSVEAMKMEHVLSAPFDGVVAELNVQAGQQVAEGATLVRLEAPDHQPLSRPHPEPVEGRGRGARGGTPRPSTGSG